MQKNRLGIQPQALLVLLILLIAASIAVAADEPPVAQGGGLVDLPPSGDFQVHHHTFGFILLKEGDSFQIQLQYHDHHEGAASVPIHDEASAFSLHMTSLRRFKRGLNWVYLEGRALKRTTTQGQNPGLAREYVCVWAEDGGAAAPDRFHLETEPRDSVPGYTSGGAYLGCSRTDPPPAFVLPVDDGYVVGGGNITVFPPQ